MSNQRALNHALRGLLVCAALACGYYLWVGQPTLSRAFAVGIACVVLARLVVRARITPNPLGDGDRDFSVRPVFRGLFEGGLCFAAAFVWGIACVLAVRYLLLPDTNWVRYGLMGVPFVILLLSGAFLLIRSGVRAVYGSGRS